MSHEKKRLKYLSDKFGIAGRLQMEGDREEVKDESLKELSRLHSKSMEQGHVLHQATANYRGQGLRLWYSVRQ